MKGIFNLRNSGRKIKKVIDGTIKKDVRGIETIKPANKEERLATSATVTTTIAVIIVLITK